MTTVKEPFGTTSDGTAVDRYTLTNGGIEMQCLTYGGIITRLLVPDRLGQAGNVALGFNTVAQYERDSPYFGAIIGRYANRIADARVQLDGVRYPLAANEGRHHLHGGFRGFDKHVWEARQFRSESDIGIVLSRVSPAGEQGYPGELFTQVTYRLTEQKQLIIDYLAMTSATTVVNLTQHTYFNLSGDHSTSIADHALTIHASRYLPVDEDLIPSGVMEAVRETPFDFLTPRPIAAGLYQSDVQLRHAGGYDHTWVIDEPGRAVAPVAALSHPGSGRRLTIATTEPGLHLYSGNRLGPTSPGSGRHHDKYSGLCLEAHHFPNSPASPQFPSTVLRPGERFASRTVWSFSAE
jgi:aldose 1-epimerase